MVMTQLRELKAPSPSLSSLPHSPPPPPPSPSPLQPLVLVPEGKEPEQLLNLFKGRFIIHRKKAGSVGGAKDGVQLFQISGTAALRMRAVEVSADKGYI